MDPIDIDAIMREFTESDNCSIEQMFENSMTEFFQSIAGHDAFMGDMNSAFISDDTDADFALALSLSEENESDVQYVPTPTPRAKGKGKKRERGNSSGSSSKKAKSNASGSGSGSGEPTDKTCSICLSDMGSKNIARLPCMHAFHKGCISKWKKNECPVCRVAFSRGHMMVS